MQNDKETEKEDEVHEDDNVENQEEVEEKEQEGEMEEGIWPPQEVTQGTLEEMGEQGLKDEGHKSETTEEDEKMDRIGHRKETIRRTLKVIPNVDLAKKERDF